jgi:excisionase family DNA binding protein
MSVSTLGDSGTQQDRTDLVADGLVTVQEAAEFVSISRSKLYELMDTGELVYVKIGRSRRVPRRALIDLAARGLKGGWRS